MTDEEMIEEQNAYYMAGYPSRRSENKMTKEDDKLQQAMKQIHNLLYVYQLGKNELATARIRAEAEQFLKDNNYFG